MGREGKGLANAGKTTRKIEWTLRESKRVILWGRVKGEEIEVYLGLPSIGPPTVGNPKAHKTNRLWAQIGFKPNSLIFWVPIDFYSYLWIVF